MSNRTKRILEAALAVQTDIEDQQNDKNSVDIIQTCDIISDISNTVFNNALSPEDVEELIRNADVVFEENAPSSQDNYCSDNVDLSSCREDCQNWIEIVVDGTTKIPLEDHGNKLVNVLEESFSSQDSAVCNENLAHNKEVDITEDFRDDSDRGDADAISAEEDDDAEDNDYLVPVNESSQDENSEDDSTSINSHDGATSGKRKKSQGQNKRIENKKLRMTGKNYLGFRKPRHQKNTFHDTPREERRLKPRCRCKKSSTKKCCEISDQYRKRIFSKFWSEMTWDQRKIYVANTIKVFDKKKPVNETSRRSVTLKYHLIVNNSLHVPVCKTMYLNTLCLGEWSARSWALKAEEGMSTSTAVEVSSRPKRHDAFEEDRIFLKSFLTELNKLPSHYCRKDTDRMYLEQSFQSWNDLFKVYVKRCEDENRKVLSSKLLTITAKAMKISLYQPRKDQCDICFMHKNGNVSQEDYEQHISRKNLARSEKEKDKESALNGECYIITMDVQAVKLSPQIPASSLYYKTKLCCHNFTVYNLATKKVVCYWFNETQAEGQASTYASFLVNYLEGEFLNNINNKLPIVLYSDGCTAQNRNSILSNALLHLSEKHNVIITQKFLEKGHTQMECDSVHSAIETRLKNKEIYLPSDYLRITREARSASPYIAISKEFDFFRNFGEKSLLKYKSIRPSRMGDSSSLVTDIRVLRYKDGKISYKVNFNSEFQELPIRPSKINLGNVTFPPLYKSRIPITKTKYEHLQVIKKCLPQDCWNYYDSLPYNDAKEKT